MTSVLEFNVNQPNPERANNLALQAINSAKQGDFSSAIGHIEEAIALDHIGALNGFLGLRAHFYDSLGKSEATKSLKMYNGAKYLANAARYRDAALAYQEAAALDPLFLWPLNNLAWMLATHKEPSVRNGADAVKYAEDICKRSNWNCWSFSGTLAAAYAEAGDFRRALGWQNASLQLVPDDHRFDADIILRHFELGRAYIDEGLPVAAGSSAEVIASNAPEILRPEQISMKALRNLFEAGSLRTEIDSDQSLWISDRLRVLVKALEPNVLIVLMTIAKRTTHADTKSCLQLVNRINASRAGFIRAAYYEKKESFVFDYTIPVGEGIARQAVVDVVRSFIESVLTSVDRFDTNGLVAKNAFMFHCPD